MSSMTPDECIQYLQAFKGDPPDFLEKHGAWLLTVIGAAVGCVGTLTAYFLKSRCRTIKCWGMSCVRDPLSSDKITATDATAHA